MGAQGGDAGGIKGNLAWTYRNGSTYQNQLPATQTFGYEFGSGFKGEQYVSGGGAGWYGGLRSAENNAGGGSSFIGSSRLKSDMKIVKSMYCYNCEESDNEATKTISTTNVSSTPISNYAKIGHGHARITYLGE